MKNDNVKSFVVLVAICVFVAALMGAVNYFTAPAIEKNETEKINNALTVVMPDGGAFELVEGVSLPSSVKAAYKASNGGYVFKLVVNGYGTGMTIMCGIDEYGRVAGCDCILSNETLGKEKDYGNRLTGLDSEGVKNVDTVSSATLTTRAYKRAVSEALEAFNILEGKE